MSKNNFIYYKTVNKILEDNNFFGIIAKRNRGANRILYTFHNIRYPNVIVKVLTMRLEPNDIKSEKIVLGIKFNETEVEGWKEFINKLKDITTYKKKNHGDTKKN
jgi:hypothetical protein